MIPESEGTARSSRLLARMECAPDFPDGFRGMVAPAADALTAWAEQMHILARPVIDYVDTWLPEHSPAASGRAALMVIWEALQAARRWVESSKRDAVITLREYYVGGKSVKVFAWEPDDGRLRVGEVVAHVRWDAATERIVEERVTTQAGDG